MDTTRLTADVLRHASGPRPGFTAARILVLRDAEPVADISHGVEAAYTDLEGTLAPAPGAPVTSETRFDLASVTKLFTAAVVLEVLEDHGLALDTPVAEALPAYRDGLRSRITFRHLLTHTSGLPPTWTGWREVRGPSAARDRVLAVQPSARPEAQHVYSCVGYLHAGFAAEAMTGSRLDELVHDRITGPLGLAHTGYRPDLDLPIAATEWQDWPEPGVTRGAVHDEAARSLGGVAGNAGIFATADDLASFGEELRSGSSGVLRESTRARMSTTLISPRLNTAYGQAAGSRIGDAAQFGALARGGFGHTGFTGTMLLVNPDARLTVVVLTNRVHPNREWTDLGVFRREVTGRIAAAVESENL